MRFIKVRFSNDSGYTTLFFDACRAIELNGEKKSPQSENSDGSEADDDGLFESSTTSPTPSEDSSKPRDLTIRNEAVAQPAMFGTFNPLQMDKFRFLMNPSSAPFNPMLLQPAFLNIQQQLTRLQAPLAVVPGLETISDIQSASTGGETTDNKRASTTEGGRPQAPKRSKLLIDEILNLKTQASEGARSAESTPKTENLEKDVKDEEVNTKNESNKDGDENANEAESTGVTK